MIGIIIAPEVNHTDKPDKNSQSKQQPSVQPYQADEVIDQSTFFQPIGRKSANNATFQVVQGDLMTLIEAFKPLTEIQKERWKKENIFKY